MTTPSRTATAALLTLAASLIGASAVISSCAGTAARNDVWPALRQAWIRVEQYARSGQGKVEGAPQAIDEMREAVAGGGPAAALSLPWPIVRAAAEAGILARTQAGEIGPGVAASMTETVVRFQAIVDQMLGPIAR